MDKKSSQPGTTSNKLNDHKLLGLKELESAIKKEVGSKVRKVENLIQSGASEMPERIRKMSSYILESGGKRMRPILLLLTAKLTGYTGRLDEEFSLIYEYVHSATLVHDDIIDHAEVRRGRPSVHSKWGQSSTVLLGDYIFTSAMDRSIAVGNVPLMQLISKTVLELIEGELIQQDRRFDLKLSLDDHLAILKKKTACLFAACSKTGGMLGAGDQERTQALYRYGMYLGLAYQLSDDILDYTGDSQELGKPVLADLGEGRVTLPIIYLLRDGSKKAKTFLKTMVEERSFDEVNRHRLLNHLKDCEALTKARELTEYYANKAQEELASFPKSRAWEILNSIPGFVVTRQT